MDRISKALAKHDDAYAEVTNALFGDGLYEIVKADRQKQSRKDRTLQNVAIGTNAVGSVAGPAAVGLAVRSARKNEGGMPRQMADIAGPKLAGSGNARARKVGQGINRGAKFFRNNKKAAIASGATLVGLQGINWGGDVLSAKLISEQKKKDAIGKAMPDGFDISSTGGSRTLRGRAVGAAIGNAKVRATGRKLKDDATVAARRKAGTGAQLISNQAQKFADELSKSDESDVVWEGEFSKVDGDKRQAFGYASVVEIDGEPVVDRQGDYISPEELERAAYEYVVKSRKGGDMHKRDGENPLHVADLIESFVVTDEKVETMGLPEDTPRGWWVGFKVNDDDLWDKVKSGERAGFSIHGKGVRKDMVL